MAFWDFLPKLFKPVPPASPPSPPPEPVGETFVPVPPDPPATPIAESPPVPPAVPAPSPVPNFLPISRDELLTQGEDVRRTTGWMFFGRRDIIPPTSEPRTRLIDRGMVTQGILTPEELADSGLEALTAAGLPVLHTPADLATALGLTIPQLRWLCFHTEVATRPHYVQFEVPKKAGGTRTLAAPHAKLAAAQEWVLANVLAKLPTEEPTHGFVPGRSTVTNALPHAARVVVVNVDLEGFFPSIRFPRVRHLFRRLGYSGAVATLLALLCTECPRKKVVYDKQTYFVATGPRGLPQGASTSPAVSNQIARRLDRRLGGLAKKLGWAYTRYADDLTFSAPPGHREQVAYVLARVRHVAADEGFSLNAKKTRVQRPESRQAVTGLVVNVTPAVPRDVVRRVRAILHRAKQEGLDAQNRTGHPNFRGWVEGMIAYVAMVKPAQGEALRKRYAAL